MTLAVPPLDEAPPPPPFEEHVHTATQNVRRRLLELMAAVGADPNRPQHVARRFGLRPGLTWKVCKVAQAVEVENAVPHMPGGTGFRLFLDGLARGGAPPDLIEAAAEAEAGFQRMMDLHAGDRPTMLSMLAHLAPAAQRTQCEADRKLAFQGNSATWGVRARLSLSTQMVAPNPDDPGMVDLASMLGLFDFTRLRRTANWVLVRSVAYNDDGSPRRDDRVPIDPTTSADGGLPLLGEFCADLPEIRERKIGPGRQFELGDGPVGQTASFTCTFGSFARRFARWGRDDANRYGEHPTDLFTPSELAIADVFVHRDLTLEEPPVAALYGRLFVGAESDGPRREPDRMPLPETIHTLGTPPVVATPHCVPYPRMVRTVCDRLGWDLREFRGYRLQMPYPPIPTLLVLRYPLPDP